MSMRIVICDDSKVARRSLEKALPKQWDVDIRFAENGMQALELIERGDCELLLLDLTMPVMDGFEVLQAIRDRRLKCLTIVISGDVQESSRQRAKKLGALGFIRKPLDEVELNNLLHDYGLIRELLQEGATRVLQSDARIEAVDVLSEISNVALGDAGNLLAEMLGTSIELPVPKVHVLPYHELLASLDLDGRSNVNVVSEGFVGNAVAGEAVLLVDNKTLHQLPEKLADVHLHQFDDEYKSLLLDVASLLIAGFLKRFAVQLDLEFNTSQPAIVATQQPLYEIFKDDVVHERVLVIDIDYHIPSYDLNFDLLVIFTESSSVVLGERAEYLSDA